MGRQIIKDNPYMIFFSNSLMRLPRENTGISWSFWFISGTLKLLDPPPSKSVRNESQNFNNFPCVNWDYDLRKFVDSQIHKCRKVLNQAFDPFKPHWIPPYSYWPLSLSFSYVIRFSAMQAPFQIAPWNPPYWYCPLYLSLSLSVDSQASF